MYIDGKFVDAKNGKTFDVYDPSTEGVIARVPAGGPEDVDRAVKAAHRAFYEGGWKGGTFSQIDCDGYVSGTSGGPFIIGGDDPKVVGVTGGWQTGGHSADTSYSSYFDSDLKRIYDAAVAGREAGGLSGPPLRARSLAVLRRDS